MTLPGESPRRRRCWQDVTAIVCDITMDPPPPPPPKKKTITRINFKAVTRCSAAATQNLFHNLSSAVQCEATPGSFTRYGPSELALNLQNNCHLRIPAPVKPGLGRVIPYLLCPRTLSALCLCPSGSSSNIPVDLPCAYLLLRGQSLERLSLLCLSCDVFRIQLVGKKETRI